MSHSTTNLLRPHAASSASSHRRPPELDLFRTDDVENPLPSPPYRRDPSRTQLFSLDPYPEQSPAYHSRSNVNLNEDMPFDSEKQEHDHDDIPKSTSKTARFREDVRSPNVSTYPIPPFARADSGLSSGSRSPSIADTDDEDEDYNWDDEDDLVDEEAKFEQNMGVTQKERWGLRKFLALGFGSLIGSTLLSGMIAAPAIVIHFIWWEPNKTEYRTFVKNNVEAWLFWAAANVSISWYLALFIDMIPVVFQYIIWLFWGYVSESIKDKHEMYNSVKGAVKPIFYAASSWVSWIIIFENIYHIHEQDYDFGATRNPPRSKYDKPYKYLTEINNVIEFLFFLVLVVCCQRMLLRLVALAFHRTAYRERLQNYRETQKVIEQLRSHRPKRSHIKSSSYGFGSRSLTGLNFPSPFAGSRPGTPTGRRRQGSIGSTPAQSRSNSPERAAPSGHDADMEYDSTLVNKSDKKGKQRPSWLGESGRTKSESMMESSPLHKYPPARPGHSRRGTGLDGDEGVTVRDAATAVAKTIKSAALHDARNIQGRAENDLGGLVWDVTSAREAKRLARSIYNAFRRGNNVELEPQDFYPAFKTHEEAEAAFKLFDTDKGGQISRPELKTTIMKVYKERRLLTRSMRDVSVALKTLDHILLFFAMIILFFISLSVFGVDVGNSLTSVYSLGIAMSFIFKSSASSAFDAIMFLFVTHPFDTGDRVFIDNENLVVKKMGLFATSFARADGTDSYYFNSQLFTKFIINARRSKKTAENLTLTVDYKTPLETLDELEKCMNNWLSTEKNRWFDPSTSVTPQHIREMRYLDLTIGIGHNSNWQDWGMRNTRRTAFHAAINYYCRLLGITCYNTSIPVAWADANTYDVPDTYEVEEERVAEGIETTMQDPTVQQQELMKSPALGFQPPSDLTVRRRKVRDKKKNLQSIGFDG